MKSIKIKSIKKNISAIILAVILILGVFMISSCVTLDKNDGKLSEKTAEPAEEQETAEKTSEIKEESSAKTETEEIAAKETEVNPSYEDLAEESPLKKYENPSKGIFVISEDEPHEYLDIKSMNIIRTSRDKAELKEFALTFRNIEDNPIQGVVVIRFDDVYVDDDATTTEKEFEMPELRPGMKFVKTFPVGAYYHFIDKEKTVSISFYQKFQSPKVYAGKKTLKFIPLDVLSSLEMKWV